MNVPRVVLLGTFAFGLAVASLLGVLYYQQQQLHQEVLFLAAEQKPLIVHSVEAQISDQKPEAAKESNVGHDSLRSNSRGKNDLRPNGLRPLGWAEVQARAKDTVVQVFSQIGEVDILQPFRTPAQGQSFGSGFFINDQGELVTNAHVVANVRSVWIQIPSLGKRIIDVDVVGVCPERDLALLKVTPEGVTLIKTELGKIPYLPLGDSDRLFRSEELLALGYPLAQYSLKSTVGVVSGRENIGGQQYIQMSAPINPGSSGGPSLNHQAEVIGVNSASIPGAQNVNYIIPINELKIIIDDLRKVKLLRKPFLGIVPVSSSESLVEYLGNPKPGGVYIVEVYKNSLMERAGVKSGDMIYKIDQYDVDLYGEMNVPWSEDKITIADYVSRLKLNQQVCAVLYRKGVRKNIAITFSLVEQLPIRTMYTDYEPVDYEIVGGMVIMPLTLNHVAILAKHVPDLMRYAETKAQLEPALLITHLFPDSQAHRSRAIGIGAIIDEVNGVKAKTMNDLRSALLSHKKDKYITFKTTNNLFVAFPRDKTLREEQRLAHDYHYSLSETIQKMMQLSSEQ